MDQPLSEAPRPRPSSAGRNGALLRGVREFDAHAAELDRVRTDFFGINPDDVSADDTARLDRLNAALAQAVREIAG